ncbi:ABC multidrug transporter [Paraphaeosphaeria sporulosa]
MSSFLGIQGETECTTQDFIGSSSSSNLDAHSRMEQGEEREQVILSLAREFTVQSHQTHHESPFQASEGSTLDPNSSAFDARSWAKAFYNIRYTSDVPARVAGVAFKNLNVSGVGSPTDFQSSVANSILKLPALFGRGAQKIEILRDLDGLVLPGEQCCVLGPPGSGCSTLLKTIAGETHGFKVNPDSQLNYHGIAPAEMHKQFRGEAIYTAEVDRHYPQLTVGDTLYFAALARTPRTIPGGVSREQYAEHIRDVIMAMFGISHTINTCVGNDFVRGVSGGERKRVTIAEAALSYAPLQCWDNSTRGLDSANAVEFCKTLRTQCDVFGSSTFVAIYQAPQAAYDLFDKVTVLYEGRQIYFGPAQSAKSYFEQLGFSCPDAQTVPDFLTSMTSPSERVVKPGFENRVPRTSDDFARCWQQSEGRKILLAQIDEYTRNHALDGVGCSKFAKARKVEKSKAQRERSPYTLSYWGQVKLCMWRDVQRLKADPSVPISMLLINFIEGLIIASIFFNLADDTSAFFSRGAVLFMMHPSAEALASMIVDMPYKITNAVIVNTTLYFMANLRRDAGSFFFFFLVAFSMLLSMSMFFRFFASITKTIAQALAPSSIILMGLVLYTGFAIPVADMRGWASWIRYINPISYGFESVIVNEFDGRQFPCAQFVPSGPSYEAIAPDQRACAVKGAVAGANYVNGTAFASTTYNYQYANRWRNFGIIVVFVVGLAALHLITSELVASARSKGEVLVFRRKNLKAMAKRRKMDEETGRNTTAQTEKYTSDSDAASIVKKQQSILHWEDVCYEVQIKGNTRKILQNVDGWVKPGTLTALMGVSGAGKTTLLDVLASRTTMGVISGSMFVDGRERDGSFQRQTGYVMQQDIHLHSSTVREALEFSALLRQPADYSRGEKLAYVDEVIRLLDMEDYAEAVVGVPGDGLNVEQRKRLTIGVEIAARPRLLLFLDEPTSGLDSQTSWSICDLMEKLTKNGQAILCTIHQPSAMLFQRFDRLLLLAKGGRTVYFGDIGSQSHILVDYFERNGGPKYDSSMNPAEYMLDAIGATPGSTHTEIDWPAVWKSSTEYAEIRTELARLRQLRNEPSAVMDTNSSSYQEFAAPFATQFLVVANRCAQQYWRTPSYIYSKALLSIGCSLFIGFSFYKMENSIQGLQNQMFGIFVFLFVVIQLMFQIMPNFVVQRTLYEARERQSKTYVWQAFLFSNIFIEMFWNLIMGTFCFLVWFYPVGLYRNAEPTDSVSIRSFGILLIIVATFMFASSFAHMLIAGAPNEEVAGGIATIMSIMLYAFCGILAGPDKLPGFWIFMYRANPFTYLVSSFMSTALGQAPAYCLPNEFQTFLPPPNQTCGQYMQDYIGMAGGYLQDPRATDTCNFCQLSSTDQFLQQINATWENRWRDFGLLWVYVVFNVAAATALYWLCRVPGVKKKTKTP